MLPIELRFIQALSSVSMNLIGVKILNSFPNEKKKKSLTFVVAENFQERKMIKSPMWDSNTRPSVYKTAALPLR